MSKLVNTVNDVDYRRFEALIADRVSRLTGKLFVTSANVFDNYMVGLGRTRQHYDCRACQRFMERYGGLVRVLPSGRTESVLWNPVDVPLFFLDSVEMMQRAVEHSEIQGIFVNESPLWGTPVTGEWTHLHGHTDLPIGGNNGIADYQLLLRNLGTIPREAMVQVLRVLESDLVDRSEKVIDMARWLHSLYDLEKRGRQPRLNLIWKGVAEAPAGWCHIKSSVIGSLIEDIVNGLPFEDIKRRWNALAYQRPTALSDGNIEAGNKLIEELGYTRSLPRRFAKLEDITQWIWRPGFSNPESAGGGVFDHLKRQKIKPVDLPAGNITWSKFRDGVLPGVRQLELLAPASGQYFALTIQDDLTAPNILQWSPPIGWYFYHPTSLASRWGVSGWTYVTGIIDKPCNWNHVRPDKGPGVMFLLSRCRDLQYKGNGLFFPENIISELRPVRKALEAYSQAGKIKGVGDANGWAFTSECVVRANGIQYKVTYD